MYSWQRCPNTSYFLKTLLPTLYFSNFVHTLTPYCCHPHCSFCVFLFIWPNLLRSDTSDTLYFAGTLIKYHTCTTHTQAYSIYIQRPEDWHNHINTYLHHAPVMRGVNMFEISVSNIWVDSVSLDKGFVCNKVLALSVALLSWAGCLHLTW